MTEQRVFTVRMSNSNLMAWLNCLAKRFGRRTMVQILADQSITGIKPIIRGEGGIQGH